MDADGNYLVDGSTHVRVLNRNLQIDLPTNGPKTLNGLILEHMEFIPDAGTSLKIADYPIEVMQVKGNMIKTVRLQTNPVNAIRQAELPLDG